MVEEDNISATEAENVIEAAEEAGDLNSLLSIIETTAKYGGDPDESEEAEEWETPTESALDAFYRLTKGGDAAPSTSLSILWNVLDSWKSSEAIIEVCLGCIVYASKAVDDNSVKNIDTKLIITIMQQYKDEGTIQEQACLAIESMALSSQILKEKLSCDEVKEELIAAKDRINNERNKKYPGLAAAALNLEL